VARDLARRRSRACLARARLRPLRHLVYWDFRAVNPSSTHPESLSAMAAGDPDTRSGRRSARSWFVHAHLQAVDAVISFGSPGPRRAPSMEPNSVSLSC
jgi:hypothetical protein